MTLSESLTGLDLYDYQIKITQYDNNRLENNIYKKRRQCAAGAFGIATGIATAVHTGGISLVGTLYSSRVLSVAKHKLDIMEQEWTRRKLTPLENRKRDVIAPVVIGAAALGFAHVIASGFDSASSVIHHAAKTMQPYEKTHLHLGSTAASHGTSWGINSAGERGMKHRDIGPTKGL